MPNYTFHPLTEGGSFNFVPLHLIVTIGCSTGAEKNRYKRKDKTG